jgi:hypothetical protein
MSAKRQYSSADLVFAVLLTCQGEDRAMSARDIGAAIRPAIADREVRRIIAANRAKWMDEYDCFVCTKSGGGFWLADHVEQVFAMLRHFELLKIRACAKFAAEKAACERHGIFLPKSQTITKGKK